VETELSEFELSDLITDLEEHGFIVLPPSKGELTELLLKWYKRPLPDQLELKEWLRNRLID